LTLPRKNLDEWWNGKYVSDAFPDMPVEQRELLITGIHPECWKELGLDEAF